MSPSELKQLIRTVLERGRVELLQRRRRIGLLQAQSLEFALKQFASVLDVARAIELVEPRAHLLARTRAGEESVGRHQPVATRCGHLAGEALDPVAALPTVCVRP